MQTRLINLNARKLRAEALRLARAEGWHYSKRNDCHQFYPGKFEAEPFEAVSFYDSTMNGSCVDTLFAGEFAIADIFELSDIDHAAFDIDAGKTHAVLFYSDQGFILLEYATAQEIETLRAKYEQEGEEE